MAAKDPNPHINPQEVVEQLVSDNLPLVNYAIKIWFHHSKFREDLEAYGYLGLVKAARRFNPVFGYKFSTFAVPVIRREIVDGLRIVYFTIHIPDSAIQAVYNEEDHITVEPAKRAMRMRRLSPRLSCTRRKVSYYDDHEDVHRAVRCVPERYRSMIVKRYGLDGKEPQTVSDIAKSEGLTKQRISQLLAVGHRLIANHYLALNLNPYPDKEEKVCRDFYRTAKDRERAYAAGSDPAGNGHDCGTDFSGIHEDGRDDE